LVMIVRPKVDCKKAMESCVVGVHPKSQYVKRRSASHAAVVSMAKHVLRATWYARGSRTAMPGLTVGKWHPSIAPTPTWPTQVSVRERARNSASRTASFAGFSQG